MTYFKIWSQISNLAFSRCRVLWKGFGVGAIWPGISRIVFLRFRVFQKGLGAGRLMAGTVIIKFKIGDPYSLFHNLAPHF